MVHFVQKAGTVVLSKDNPEKILLLYQKKYNDFSFPKGHVENAESLEDCAIRETKEETGLDVKLLRLLNVTTYSNKHDGNVEVSFFLARSLDDAVVKPEAGCQVLWMDYETAMQKLSYENLKTVLKAVKEIS